MTTNEDLALMLGRVEQKVDTLIERDADKEKRISSLERSRSWLTGAAAAVGALVSFVFSSKAG